jgi:hypothetical protein
MVIGHILHNDADADADANRTGEKFHSMWLKVITGFTSHTFVDDYSKVVTEFWDTNQNVIYNMTVSRVP